MDPIHVQRTLAAEWNGVANTGPLPTDSYSPVSSRVSPLFVTPKKWQNRMATGHVFDLTLCFLVRSCLRGQEVPGIQRPGWYILIVFRSSRVNFSCRHGQPATRPRVGNKR